VIARLNQFASVLDAEPKAKVVPPDRRRTIRLRPVECPQVADMFQCGRTPLRSGWWPGVSRELQIVGRETNQFAKREPAMCNDAVA